MTDKPDSIDIEALFDPDDPERIPITPADLDPDVPPDRVLDTFSHHIKSYEDYILQQAIAAISGHTHIAGFLQTAAQVAHDAVTAILEASRQAQDIDVIFQHPTAFGTSKSFRQIGKWVINDPQTAIAAATTVAAYLRSFHCDPESFKSRSPKANAQAAEAFTHLQPRIPHTGINDASRYILEKTVEHSQQRLHQWAAASRYTRARTRGHHYQDLFNLHFARILLNPAFTPETTQQEQEQL